VSDVTEINVQTGEVTTRPYTKEELDARANAVIPESVLTIEESLEEYKEVKQSALSKLQALGLTPEEIASLSN
jgi:DNA-directed RNA polymerase specialized sigma24 family protein